MDTSTIFLLTTIISILAKLQILKIHDENVYCFGAGVVMFSWIIADKMFIHE